MPYTPVPKPTSPTYTNVNPVGLQQYDQADVLYDDPNVFYDGVDLALYTNVTKPVIPTYTNVPKPS